MHHYFTPLCSEFFDVWLIAVKTLGCLWKKSIGHKEVEKRVFCLPSQVSKKTTFRMKYDKIQKQLETIAGMDDLLSGIDKVTSTIRNCHYRACSCMALYKRVAMHMEL